MIQCVLNIVQSHGVRLTHLPGADRDLAIAQYNRPGDHRHTRAATGIMSKKVKRILRGLGWAVGVAGLAIAVLLFVINWNAPIGGSGYSTELNWPKRVNVNLWNDRVTIVVCESGGLPPPEVLGVGKTRASYTSLLQGWKTQVGQLPTLEAQVRRFFELASEELPESARMADSFIARRRQSIAQTEAAALEQLRLSMWSNWFYLSVPSLWPLSALVGFHIHLLIALLVLPATITVFRALLFRRRIVPGHCLGCRYDLRGITSGICPECGLRLEG